MPQAISNVTVFIDWPKGEVFDMTVVLLTNDVCVSATIYPFEKHARSEIRGVGMLNCL